MPNELIRHDQGVRRKAPRLGTNNQYTIFTGNITTISASGGGFPTFNIEYDGGGNFYNGGSPEQLVSRREAPIFVSMYIEATYAASPTGEVIFDITHSNGSFAIARYRDTRVSGTTNVSFTLSGGVYAIKDSYNVLTVLNNSDQNIDVTARAIIFTLT